MLMNNELNIITQIRGKVESGREPTGENLFLVWGYPTVIVLLIEFIVAMNGHGDWCEWLWICIPMIGAPLMAYYLKKDYERTGHRTLDANIALRMWLFVGFCSCIGGFSLGITGIFEIAYCAFQGLLIGVGCYVTGVILRFHPMMVCGAIGAVVSFFSLFFQGHLWPWQLLIATIVAVITLIIPGHMFRNKVKSHGI